MAPSPISNNNNNHNRRAKQLQLDCIQTIGRLVSNINDETQYRKKVPGFPVDIKLSHNHSCILIADFYNNAINILDIHTKTFKLSIKIPISPILRILIEENYESANKDALIISSNDEMIKYDLATLIETAMYHRYADCLWRLYASCEFKGMTLVREEDGNKIYVCGSPKNCVAKVDCLTGLMNEEDEFVVISGFQPVKIDLKDDDACSMIVGIRNNFPTNLFQIYSQNERGVWSCVKSIAKEGLFSYPQDEDISFSFLLDQTNQFILLNKEGHGLLMISVEDGSIVKSFENRKEGANIGGMCFNSITGELFVCDAQYGVVRVFK